MRDRQHADLLLRMSRKDYTALSAMVGDERFADEVFGFHCQQAVEKAAKSLLSLNGIEYRWIHDLDELFSLLKAGGQDLSAEFRSLADLTDFAVMFRYEPFEFAHVLVDREDLDRRIGEFLSFAETVINEEE